MIALGPDIQNYSTEKEILEFIRREFCNAEIGDIDIISVYLDDDPYGANLHCIFVENGELWEVEAWHCSCYGFEDEWKPQKTYVNYLLSENFPERYRSDQLEEELKRRGFLPDD